ncbi:serine/threonine protein kinase [Humibacillus xanthopallidus]|uniref:Serine/threonine protein kinase n=1 Tax=Humibacillus xanthopallidus TaxID=412689 RepID=A0A543PLP4_9MICO|nr:phosphotransferase [Humibacillus xanthopallidus]TQN44996.1 serine/threonine protein kinase [Humibacillus xanthopallidus]
MTVADVRYVLPTDAETVALPDHGEVLLARRGSRVTPQLLSADSMRLLEQFRTPSTLTQAILGYCSATASDPVSTLEAAFPVLVALTHADLLVPDGSDSAAAMEDRQRVGEVAGPATITARLRTLRDSEIWRGELCDGTAVVVKIVDDAAFGPDLFAREVAALCRLSPLAGTDVPQLVWREASPTGGTLVLSEVVGDPVDLAVADRDDDDRRAVAVAVLDAYTALHDRGVLHGDVHAGNVLLRPDGTVTVIDFGLAQLADATAEPGMPVPRAAGGEGLDPSCARALLRDRALPPLDTASEQYAIAALVHRVLTSTSYLDLACEREEALRRITADEPRRFAAVGAAPWPSGERVLRRALAKSPAERFASTTALRDALASATRASNGDTRASSGAARAGLVAVADEGTHPETELRRAVEALEVDGAVWQGADPDEAAHAAWFLQRVADLSGDVTAHDLAAVWTLRAGGSLPTAPRPDEGVTRAHGELDAYCRTGHDVHLRRARAIATRLGTAPVWRVDVRRGRWASVLATLECERPADALLPGSPA